MSPVHLESVLSRTLQIRAWFWLVITLAISCQFSARAQDWAGFHGLEHQGVALNGPPPIRWATNENVIWKRPIPGSGFSSPVVVGNGVYLTTAYETSKGAVARIVIRHATAVLGFALFAMTAIGIIGSGAGEWPAKRWLPSAAGIIATTVTVMTVLAICLFAERVLGLEASRQRSWKIGTLAATLAVSPLFFLPGQRAVMRWLFVLATSLVGALAFLYMPKRELFLDLGSSDGITSTAILVFPTVLACGLVWAAAVLSRRPPTVKFLIPPVRESAMWWRVALGCVVPAIVVGGLFAALMLRARNYANSSVSFVPTVGWTVAVAGGVLCLATTGFGLHLAQHNLSVRRWARSVAIVVALLTAAGCFVQFGCLPGGKQTAHAVVCVDRQDGTIRWLREVAQNDQLSDLRQINSRATPTLAADADTILAYFGSEGMAALDLQGRVKWRLDHPTFEGQYGVGHSPTVADGVALVVADCESASGTRRGADSHIAAYRMADGQLLWQRQRSVSKAGFSTPIIRHARERRVALVRSWDDIAAYDLRDGSIRWTYPLRHQGQHLVSSMIADQNRLYVSDAARFLCLDLPALEEGKDPVRWTLPLPGEKASTPVVVGNTLFGVTESGNAFCIDAEKGALAWKEKLPGRFFASVLAFGDAVLFTSEKGEASLYKRAPRAELLAQNSLGEKIYATPVPQRDSLLVRAVEHLYLIGDRGSVPVR